jgi:uncharacterized integral membrane protein
MTQPGQPPYGPNQPAQGGPQSTSSFPATGPVGSGQQGSAPGQPGQPGQPAAPAGGYGSGYGSGTPGAGYPAQPQDSGRGSRIKQGPGWFTYLLTLLAAVIAIAIAVFIAQNTDEIPIDFFGTTRSVSTAAALGIALAAGFLIGLFLGLIPAFKAKRELRQLRRGQH